MRPGIVVLAGWVLLSAVDCRGGPEPAEPVAFASQEGQDVSASDPTAAERQAMVETQLEARGLEDPRVLAAMARVPRHRFVRASEAPLAYEDTPLPIGHGQTISQPYIVGLMTALAEVGPGDKVLEVGTGSGYQAAVLAELGAEVFTIEIVAPLAERAAATLEALGYETVHVRFGDGYAGWPEAAPFDAVVVTAAPPEIPQPLKDQVAPGGHLVIPVGRMFQALEVHTRTEAGWTSRTEAPVRFVPMTGRAQEEPPPRPEEAGDEGP